MKQVLLPVLMALILALSSPIYASASTITGLSPTSGAKSGGTVIEFESDISSKFTQVAIGQFHALGLTADGQVYGWGANWAGELGEADGLFEAFSPVHIDLSTALGGAEIAQIAASSETSAVLTTDGKVYVWGNNGGIFGNGSTADSPTPVAVDMSGVLAGKTITQFALGGNFALALTTDGGLYTWGQNTNGQLGNGTTANSSVPVAVDMSGVLAGKTITQISTGAYFSIVLADDGTVFTWGSNINGQLGIGTIGSANDSSVPVAVDTSGVLAGKNIALIEAGFFHGLALDDEGDLYSWGANYQGQLGNGVSGTGADSGDPVAVDMSGVLSGKTIISLGSGFTHSFAIDDDGVIYGWGQNFSGELGDGTTVTKTTPVAIDMTGVLAGKQIVSASGGEWYSGGLASDGTAFITGHNYWGQHGNGSSVDATETPVLVDMSAIPKPIPMVLFAGIPALSVEYVSGNTFRAVAPAGMVLGAVDVSIEFPGESPTVLAGAYTYVADSSTGPDGGSSNLANTGINIWYLVALSGLVIVVSLGCVMPRSIRYIR